MLRPRRRQERRCRSGRRFLGSFLGGPRATLVLENLLELAEPERADLPGGERGAGGRDLSLDDTGPFYAGSITASDQPTDRLAGRLAAQVRHLSRRRDEERRRVGKLLLVLLLRGSLPLGPG